MDEDLFSALGLVPIQLADRTVLQPFYHSIDRPLSDYTFANTFIWARAINAHWAILHQCLCVFANGAGDLTLLAPPLPAPSGEGAAPPDVAAALAESVERCRAYNASAGVPQATRVEYVSEPWLARHGAPTGYRVSPMSGDYVYPTRRMIDLDGPDLAAKRQMRNRFARRYAARTEPYTIDHLDACLGLLARWHEQVTAQANQTGESPHAKCDKELIAVEAALRHHEQLGLTGMVLWAGDELAGFTFAEPLGADSFSVLIEKTDRRFTGAAQFIFSEFCRLYWSDRTWCNAGDDWGIENLARVKESYHPAGRECKFTLYPPAPVPTAPPPLVPAGVVETFRSTGEPAPADAPAAVLAPVA